MFAVTPQIHALFTILAVSAKHLYPGFSVSRALLPVQEFLRVFAQCIDYAAVDQLESSEQNAVQISF